jgi:putative Holliday junction resolvase
MPGKEVALRILGLDVGTARVGVALSDELGLTAQPLTALEVRGGISETGERIRELCEQHEVARVVVGLPLALDGGDRGAGSHRARAVGAELERIPGVEVVYWDERFSTVEAERVLVSAGVRRRDRRSVVDKVAAALILQGYLDAQSAQS